MIVTTEIQNIVYDLCRVFDIDVMQTGVIPTEEITEERIVIAAKTVEKGTYWNKAYVEVNFVVPDIDREANLIRLQELEVLAKDEFKDTKVGTYNDETWCLDLESLGTHEDRQTRTHYVNAHLLFQVLNFSH